MTIIEIAAVIDENPKEPRTILRKAWRDRVIRWRAISGDTFLFMNVDPLSDEVMPWLPYLYELLADDWEFVET